MKHLTAVGAVLQLYDLSVQSLIILTCFQRRENITKVGLQELKFCGVRNRAIYLFEQCFQLLHFLCSQLSSSNDCYGIGTGIP